MKKNLQTHLSVVIPAYNEELNFKAGVLRPSFEFLKKQKFRWDVLFVDDGSTDKTKTLLKNFCKKNPHCHLLAIAHGGRAAAMRVGMLEAQGKYTLYTDFDQSTALSEVEKFLAKIRAGKTDIIIGARGQGKTERKDSFLNKIRADAFLLIARALMGLQVKDINCGFKLYRREVAQQIFSSLIVSRPRKIKHAYMGAIDSEILFLAKKYKFKIAEMPVNWTRRPFVSHLNLWKEVTTILQDLFAMKLYSLMGKYDSVK